MNHGIDLSQIYSLKNKYTVIGLTGRTAAGCTELAKILQKGFDKKLYPRPRKTFTKNDHNFERDYRVIYNFAKINFPTFTLIEYKHVLSSFLIRKPLSDFINFLESPIVKTSISKYDGIIPDYKKEIENLVSLSDKWEKFSNKINAILIKQQNTSIYLQKLHAFYFDPAFLEFSENIQIILSINTIVKRNKILQIISNNLRMNGDLYNCEITNYASENVYCIAEFINDIIKGVRIQNKIAHVVIDSFRNPLEIMFFKERFSAFYMISVNRDELQRQSLFIERYKEEEVKHLIKMEVEEYKREKIHEFHKQNVSECIQRCDLHMEFITEPELGLFNEMELNKGKYGSPKISIYSQILRYIALMNLPGIVTPTAEERSMQLAYTAKYNSGCISRQVGAVVTDHVFSVKSIGWNDVPQGQVPCLMRNVQDLIEKKNDIDAFSEYEKTDTEFQNCIHLYTTKIKEHKKKLKGRNVCYCFKTVHNSIKDGKNQVHTRSLHAEENAFLQIAKKGGVGLENGNLFSTASPCELCSKKAYQLGVKLIYYVDPYPGISKEHILVVGDKIPILRQFVGAVGVAYHKFYEPIMPYKDELSNLLGIEFDDLLKKHEKELSILKEDMKKNNKEKEELINKIKLLNNNNDVIKQLISVLKK